MAEETHLEMLQRKVRTAQRRQALCYLVAQILGDDKIVMNPSERPETLLNLVMHRNDSIVWESHRSWVSAISKVISGRIEVRHRDLDPSGREIPVSEQKKSWPYDLHVVIHRGAIPAPDDLFAQEEMLDRALIVIQQELDSIRKDIAKDEKFPKTGPYR